jgi:hypothetical protein
MCCVSGSFAPKKHLCPVMKKTYYYSVLFMLCGLFSEFTAQAATYTWVGNYHTWGESAYWIGGVPPSGGTNDIINIEGPCNFNVDFVIGPGTVMNCNAPYFGTQLYADLTNNGTINVNVVLTINLSSILVNNGTLNLSGYLDIGGGFQNNSTGSFIENTSGYFDVRPSGSYINSGTHTIPAGATGKIRGSMSLAGTVHNNGSFINEGTSTFQNTAVFNNNAGASITDVATINQNAGTLNNLGSYTKNAGTYTNALNATITNNGTFTVNAGTFTNLGLFTGSGTYSGLMTNNGTVAPGTTTPGTLTVTGTYTQTGTLAIQFGSTYDVLSVSGPATIGGTLSLSTVSGYMPPAGACGYTFDILTCSALTGTFSSVNLPTGWIIEYLPTGVRLRVEPAFNTFVGGGLDENWSNPANWSGCAVPTGTVNYPITIAANCILDVDITMNSTFTIDTTRTFVIYLGKTLHLLIGKTLINRGTLTNLGTLLNAGTLHNTHQMYLVQLTNTGTLHNWKNLQFQFGGASNNNGTLHNHVGATISASAVWTNTPLGMVINQGLISNSDYIVNQGILTGTGTLDGFTNNAGTFEPGLNAIGSMTANGPLELASTSVLKVEIGGYITGQYDQIVVGNNGFLFLNGGSVHITLVNGYIPAPCTEYLIVSSVFGSGPLPVVLNQPVADWEVIAGTGGLRLRYSGPPSSHTFTGGGGDSYWSNNNNWLECIAPPDNVLLPVTIQTQCNIDRDIVMNNRMTVQASAYTQVNTGKSLKITTGDSLLVYGNFTNLGTFELEGVVVNHSIFACPGGSVNDFKAGSLFYANSPNSGLAGATNLLNGTVQIGTPGRFYIYDAATVGATGTIQVGFLMNVEMGATLNNYGTISTSASGTIGMLGAISNFNVLTNEGTLQVNTSGSLSNTGTLTSPGQIQNMGTITNQAAGQFVCNGTFQQDGSFQNLGTLSGIGNITPTTNWTNNGTIAPGNPSGTLTVTGDCALSTRLLIEITETQFDALVVTGTAQLGGILEINAPLAPSVCNEYIILTAGSISGSFDNFMAPIGWALEINPTSVKIIYGGTPATQTFLNTTGDGLWSNRLNWSNCVLPYSAIGSNNTHIIIANDCTLDMDVYITSSLTINATKVLSLMQEMDNVTSSTINVQGTLAIVSGGFTLFGTLTGNGTITGDINNYGTIRPGTSPGVLTVNGSYNDSEASDLMIEINGTAPGQFDQLVINGTAEIEGVLTIEVGSGFSSAVCADFLIIPCTNIVGTFDEINLPNTTNWSVRYTPAGVVVTYSPSSTRTFVGPGTLWSDAANWAECAPPPSGYTGNIIINANCALDRDFFLNANLNVSPAATLTIESDYTLYVLTGANLNFYNLVNNGDINVEGNWQMGPFGFYPALINNGNILVNTPTADLIYRRSINNTGLVQIVGRSFVLESALISTGDGTVLIEMERFITLSFASAQLSTVNGDISLRANIDGNESGQFIGIDVPISITSTGSGDISLHGGGGDGSFGNLSGINISSIGLPTKIECTGTGHIYLQGIGGDGGNSGGINMGYNATVKTNTGDIYMEGSGGAGGSNQYGISLFSNTLVTSTGDNADIEMVGQGGSATSGGTPNSNAGIWLSGTVRVHNGSMTIEGTGGSAGENNGVYMENGTVQSTGSGPISVTGTGGSADNYNHGIQLYQNGLIRGNTGPVELIGYAGVGNSDGFRMNFSSAIHNGTGTTTITGISNGNLSDIDFYNGNIIGADTTTGQITLICDTYQGGQVNGSGELHIRPRTNSTTIGIRDGIGTLHLDNSEVSAIQEGFSRIVIGDLMNGTGVLQANNANFQDPLTLVGGSVEVTGLQAQDGQTRLIARTGNVKDLSSFSGYDVNCSNLSISTPNGFLAPGNSPGLFTVTGNYTHTDNYEVEIEGTGGPGNIGGHDQLQVNGTLNLGGTLTVKFLNGYTPTGSEQFVLATATTLNGQFANVIFEPSNISGSIQYINNQVILSSIILPVEMSDFAGKALHNATLLTWKTATEVNNHGFFVTRTTDGTQWQDLGFVPAHSGENTPSTYEFYDRNPAEGINYYRLRQVDLDGKSTQSAIVQVTFGQVADLLTWPNPVSTWLQLTWADEANGDLYLYNPLGQLVTTQHVEDQQQTQLDVSTLQSGIYELVFVTDGGLRLMRKVVVQR